MDYDQNKVDDAVLALLYLTLHDYNRAWKGHAWEVMDRLFEKGLIYDPRDKAKSVTLTDEGLQMSESLFQKLFQSDDSPNAS